MPTVETSLGYLIDVRDEFGLNDEVAPISYVFKLGCGCSVYNKEDVLGHLVKHHVRIDEIDNIWAGFDVARESLNSASM